MVVAEHLPEISDKVLEELNKQVTQLIYTMNCSLDNAFANFDRQRDELQRYVTAERQALVDQLRESADGVVQRALDAVPGLVGKSAAVVVLALVVLSSAGRSPWGSGWAACASGVAGKEGKGRVTACFLALDCLSLRQKDFGSGRRRMGILQAGLHLRPALHYLCLRSEFRLR